MKIFKGLLYPITIMLSLSSCSTFIYIGKTHAPERTLDKKPPFGGVCFLLVCGDK
jgi:hypothetical protein